MKKVLALTLVILAMPARADNIPAWFAALDRDGNGAIVLDELHNARYQRFARMDTDGDEQLSLRELRNDRTWLSRFTWFDSNGNGQISIDEYEAKGMARFSMLDTNGDGSITLAELRAITKAAKRSKANTSG